MESSILLRHRSIAPHNWLRVGIHTVLILEIRKALLAKYLTSTQTELTGVNSQVYLCRRLILARLLFRRVQKIVLRCDEFGFAI